MVLPSFAAATIFLGSAGAVCQLELGPLNHAFFSASPQPVHEAASPTDALCACLEPLVLLDTPYPFSFPSFTTHKMQRALNSRARATALSAAATKYRAGAGLGQQLRFAHKVCFLRLLCLLMAVSEYVRC